MPRLKKGQTADGIKTKSDAVRRNAEHRVRVFQGLCSLEKPPLEDLAPFQSAEKLALWSSDSYAIFPISVKTLRKHVDTFYPGGLAALCATARAKLNGEMVTAKPTMATDHRRNASLAVDAALEMTARYLDLLERIKRMANKSKEIEFELDKHLRRYGQHPHIQEVS